MIRIKVVESAIVFPCFFVVFSYSYFKKTKICTQIFINTKLCWLCSTLCLYLLCFLLHMLHYVIFTALICLYYFHKCWDYCMLYSFPPSYKGVPLILCVKNGEIFVCITHCSLHYLYFACMGCECSLHYIMISWLAFIRGV